MATETRRPTLAGLAQDLAKGRTTSAALVNVYLDRIRDSKHPGAASFIRVYESRARQEAADADLRRASGDTSAPLAGIPISVKDLFDVAGDVTTAGSVILKADAPATHDALIVHRLRAAGAIILGRTNMTEFAYSVLGLNPHYGTPANPYDAARIPGGSSSGAATAVAYDLCAASIGTDTAGSIRVPAAFCGLVGFKPTQQRVSRAGAYPLCASLDSIGPIANSVACCALLDAVVAGQSPRPLAGLAVRDLKFGYSERLAADLDATVGRAYERALSKLSAAGAQLSRVDLTALDIVDAMDSLGGMIGPEAYAAHRTLLAKYDGYDPQVRSRLQLSANQPSADYIDVLRMRRTAIESCNKTTEALDGLLSPTVSVVPPRVEEVMAQQEYRRVNATIRRLPAAINVLDRCAVSLPCHRAGELPVGLTIIGESNADAHLLAVAASVEAALA